VNSFDFNPLSFCHIVTFDGIQRGWGGCKLPFILMVRKRISIGTILARVVLCLLMCGIVAGEFPELLSLTDNASNDFTVRGARSVVPPIRLSASKNVRIADKKSAPAPNLFSSRVSPFEKAELVPADVFIRHSILRT